MNEEKKEYEMLIISDETLDFIEWLNKLEQERILDLDKLGIPKERMGEPQPRLSNQ